MMSAEIETLLREAQEGDAEAQYKLGIAYCTANGVEEDFTEAAKWFQKAVDQNFLPAKRELGIMHLTGEGVEIDAAIAYSMISEASKALDPNAMYHLALMYEKGIGIKPDLYEAVKLLAYAAEMDYPGAEEDAERIDNIIRMERERKLKSRPLLNLDITDVDVEAACCKKMLDSMLGEKTVVMDTFDGPQLIGEDGDGNDIVLNKCPYCGKSIRRVSRDKY